MTDGTVSRWEDPATFWSMVTDELTWQSHGATVMQGELPNFSFFPGSYLNVSENCVDHRGNVYR
jgi:acetyl-CoA synthetase